MLYLAVCKHKINVHESPVSQALRVVLGARGPLLFLCPQALRLAHAHQAHPDSVTDTENQEKQSEGRFSYNLVSLILPTERGHKVRQPVVFRS